MKQNILTDFLQLCQSASPYEVSRFMSHHDEEFPKNDSTYVTVGMQNAIGYDNLAVLDYFFNKRVELHIDVFRLYDSFHINIRYSDQHSNFSCLDYVIDNISQHNIKKLESNLYYSLKVACENKNIKAIDYLLNQQKAVELHLNHNYYTNILPIFSYATVEVLEYFFKNPNLQHRLDPLILNNKGLYLASKTDSVEGLEYLLSLNKDFITSDHLDIALIKATIYESRNVAQFLINEYNIEPNKRFELFLHKNLIEDSLHNMGFTKYVKKLLDNRQLYQKLQTSIADIDNKNLKKKKI